MKQKIVIKVQMSCERCKTKAMKIGAVTDGVMSVGIEGGDKDQLVVIGEDVDAAKLTCKLRKKLCCHAVLLSVEEVKEKKKEEKPKEKPKEEKKGKEEDSKSLQFPLCYQYPQFPMCYEVVCDPNPSYSSCSIL